MIVVCAWCRKFLGTTEPFEDASVTHTMCGTCKRRQEWSGPATLVVRAESAHLVPVLEEILRGEPAIDVVVDRRRNGPAKPPGPERRRAATVDCPFDLLLG
jgi:hypothetical protein